MAIELQGCAYTCSNNNKALFGEASKGAGTCVVVLLMLLVIVNHLATVT